MKFLPIWQHFKHRFQAVQCPQIATSLAFTTLLSLVPLLTVGLVLFSKFPGFADYGLALREFLLSTLLPEKAGKVIATYMLQFSQKATQLTLIGSVLVLVTAILLMLTIDQAFNRIWQVKRKRPLMARLGLYWVALSFGPILFATSIAVASNMLGAWLGWADEPTWVRIALLRSVPFVLLCGLFALLYYGIPGRAVNPRHALIGGLTAGLVFTLMQRIFGLYITLFPSYTLIYGAFATIPIFLLWLYLLWLVILAGAVLVAVLPEARIAPLPNFPGQEAWIVMNLLQRLSLAQQQGELLSLGQLATDCRLAEGKCEILLERLADLNWAARTEDLHWVLARRLNGLYIDDIVEQFALSSSSIAALAEPTPWVEALQHSINPAPGSGQASLEALFILEKGAPIRQTATTIRGT